MSRRHKERDRTRTQSADSRRTNRRQYPISVHGHVEPIPIAVTVRLTSGRIVTVRKVNDYARPDCLYESVAGVLCIAKPRLTLFYGNEEILYGDGFRKRSGSAVAKHHRSCLSLFGAEREVTVQCVVCQPSECHDCGAESELTGWNSLANGLPEHRPTCACYCMYAH